MSDFYEEALTPAEKKLVLKGVCPFHPNQELDQKGPYVWCPLSEEMGCNFSTSREWIKYQTGKDPFHFELRVPKKRK